MSVHHHTEFTGWVLDDSFAADELLRSARIIAHGDSCNIVELMTRDEAQRLRHATPADRREDVGLCEHGVSHRHHCHQCSGDPR